MPDRITQFLDENAASTDNFNRPIREANAAFAEIDQQITSHTADLSNLQANLDAAEAAIAGKADPSDLITVTLPVASWVKDSTREMWTQAVTHSSIVNDVRIGISVDDDTQLALMDAGVTLRIDNNNGTATAKAFGAIPESNITVQLTLTPVEVVA